MSNPLDPNLAPESVSAGSVSSPKRAVSGSMLLSVIGLIAGVLALGLAAIPGIAFERGLPNPFADARQNDRQIEPPAEREGGVTLKFKSFTVNVGGKVPKKEAPAEVPPAVTKDPVRWFTMAAMSCALLGLVVATIGQLRERQTVLTVSSMSCCAAAITWQYFAIGIAVGAAVAAFLIVLVILGSAFN